MDRCIGRRGRIVALSDRLSKAQAALLQFAPGKPFTPDNLRSMRTDSVCATHAWPELGVTPHTLEECAPGYLSHKGDRPPSAASR